MSCRRNCDFPKSSRKPSHRFLQQPVDKLGSKTNYSICKRRTLRWSCPLSKPHHAFRIVHTRCSRDLHPPYPPIVPGRALLHRVHRVYQAFRWREILVWTSNSVPQWLKSVAGDGCTLSVCSRRDCRGVPPIRRPQKSPCRKVVVKPTSLQIVSLQPEWWSGR